ncbi:phosphoglycerate kinase [Dethiosulfatibacter aminovorans DSM 17477]|uniref:Phosphoglycerate kinase n=1 Tax=Dethiosulfatibacter aminovorans DSM 17477 TaxID=1121476 RepID=A0A1M6FD81_9FIRM|nr:phosphoglycerate kinase [Dethiosulfatibacter aminovorans]SHI95631.1 phosphoglycerate kinase [Dethiosulfatibacter aminovorans DSM 17477]
MKKQLTDLQLEGKKVLMRCDFNVPLDENLEITDDIRIRSAMESINYVLDNGGSLILMSHLGRPKGEAKKEFSLDPVAKRLADLLGKEVVFADFDDVMNNEVKEMADRLIPGEVMLLQNTRFRKEEKNNDDAFSKELASLGDVFVNDAFGTAHRGHASNVGVAKYLPSAVGFLIGKEIEAIGGALSNPKRPLTAILGGAKVSDKIGVIENLMNVADNIIIGGGMAFTFVKAQGYDVGSSLLEEDKVELAAELIKKAEEKGVKMLLPVDYKITREFKDTDEFVVVDWRNILEGHMGLDIGTKSIKLFSEVIKESKTVIWNGPMGVFEFKNFAEGTNSIAGVLAEEDVISIIGGGDSAAAVEKAGLADKMTHISTGGGASLEYMEGKILPGIDSIEEK